MPEAEPLMIPAHVPADLVFDFDYFQAPGGQDNPQLAVARLLHDRAPDIFFTPRNGGHWVVTRYQDALEIWRQPEKFSSDPKFNYEKRMYPRFTPLQYDPPEHTELRRVINPFFTPAAVVKLSSGIRQLACDLIESVGPRGQCEFVGSIASVYPVTIFLQMANVPLSDRDFMMRQVDRYFRNPEWAERDKARRVLGDYLADLLVERAKTPGDDLLSLIATSRLPERPLTPDEMLGMAAVSFFAGLDTVVAMLSFIMHFLGEHPAHYQRLVANRDLIDDVLEELVRANGVTINERGASHDFDFKGIRFRQGDRVVLLTAILGDDKRHTADPETIDFEREVSPHLAFGAGAHRCIGSHLARFEIRTFLDEWAQRIPSFRVEEVTISGGTVWMPKSLSLTWDAPSERSFRESLRPEN